MPGITLCSCRWQRYLLFIWPSRCIHEACVKVCVCRYLCVYGCVSCASSTVLRMLLLLAPDRLPHLNNNCAVRESTGVNPTCKTPKSCRPSSHCLCAHMCVTECVLGLYTLLIRQSHDCMSKCDVKLWVKGMGRGH